MTTLQDNHISNLVVEDTFVAEDSTVQSLSTKTLSYNTITATDAVFGDLVADIGTFNQVEAQVVTTDEVFSGTIESDTLTCQTLNYTTLQKPDGTTFGGIQIASNFESSAFAASPSVGDIVGFDPETSLFVKGYNSANNFQTFTIVESDTTTSDAPFFKIGFCTSTLAVLSGSNPDQLRVVSKGANGVLSVGDIETPADTPLAIVGIDATHVVVAYAANPNVALALYSVDSGTLSLTLLDTELVGILGTATRVVFSRASDTLVVCVAYQGTNQYDIFGVYKNGSALVGGTPSTQTLTATEPDYNQGYYSTTHNRHIFCSDDRVFSARVTDANPPVVSDFISATLTTSSVMDKGFLQSNVDDTRFFKFETNRYHLIKLADASITVVTVTSSLPYDNVTATTFLIANTSDNRIIYAPNTDTSNIYHVLQDNNTDIPLETSSYPMGYINRNRFHDYSDTILWYTNDKSGKVWSYSYGFQSGFLYTFDALPGVSNFIGDVPFEPVGIVSNISGTTITLLRAGRLTDGTLTPGKFYYAGTNGEITETLVQNAGGLPFRLARLGVGSSGGDLLVDLDNIYAF